MKTAEEFWAMVDQSAGPEKCWPWQGKIRKSKSGKLLYGQVYWNGRCQGTHVVAFTLANGRPPHPGMHVMHRCDFPPCCNPRCLIEGTPGQNFEDMKAKGRDVDLNAWRKEKVFCPRNHEYSEENTYRHKGKRYCRQCDRDRNKPGSARIERRNRNRRVRRRQAKGQQAPAGPPR